VPTIDDETTVTETIHPDNTGRPDHIALLVVSGVDAGSWFDLPVGGGVIGRQPDCEVCLSDPAISRRHAAVERTSDGGVQIRDLGSRNGTYLTGSPVGAAPLADGDRIQLSTETVLRVRFLADAETMLFYELRRAAITDALTGIANRRYLVARLEQELAFARRHDMPLAVMMIDLDRFKEVNDRHGHGVGDRLLEEVVHLLSHTIRQEDVLARYGGDEFVVLARGQTNAAATVLAQRLRDVLSKHPFTVVGNQVHVTLSIGIAGFEPACDAGALTAQQLLTRADAALYRAKEQGRDDVALWSARPSRPQDYAGDLRATVHMPRVRPPEDS
jgi:diguanylate cyclase (GGDEF)-like protein